MAHRLRGEARMRELGMLQVSFWLTPDEMSLVRGALGKGRGKPGRMARKLLMEWAEAQPTTAELAAAARRELGEYR